VDEPTGKESRWGKRIHDKGAAVPAVTGQSAAAERRGRRILVSGGQVMSNSELPDRSELLGSKIFFAST